MLRTLALLLYLLPGVVYANHDDRDPQGICYFSADVTRSWAFARDLGYSPEKLYKEGVPTEEEFAQMDVNIQRQVKKFVKKGFELVYDEKVETDNIFNIFYEWCIPTLPKETF